MALVGNNLSYAGNWKPEWGNWQNIPWQQMTPQQQTARVADDNAWKRDHGLLPQSQPSSSAPSFDFGGSSSMAPGPELFQPNLYPKSSSFSGLDEKSRKQINEKIVPEMIDKAMSLPDTINKYTDEASNLYQRLSRRAIDDSQNSILANLANRNVLNSSVASDAVSKAISQIVPYFSDKGYQSAMEAAKMQATVPSILGQLVSLAKYSKGSSSNPLAPYELMSNFVLGF